MASDEERLELDALRAEVAALRASERVYRTLVDASQDVIWSTDGAGLITFVNRAGLTTYGRTLEEMIGRSFADFIDARSRDAVVAQFAKDLGSGTDIADTLADAVRSDGSIVTLATNARVLRDDHSQPIGVVGISRDVTAQTQAARQMRAQTIAMSDLVAELDRERTRLAEAQSVASVGSWELDLRTNVLTWSDEAYRLFEVTPDKSRAVTYDDFLARVHPEDRATVDRTFRNSVTQHGPYTVEHRTLSATGAVKILHERCQTIYDDEGAPVRSVGTTQDVTARSRAETELYESRQALRAVLDAVPLRVFWKDCDSVYMGCNRAFAHDMGFLNPEDVIGKTDDDAAWKESAALYRADDRGVVESGNSRLAYDEPMERDGQTMWLRTSKVALRGRDGKVSGVLGVYEDITAYKQLEERLTHAQRLESVGTLAAGMAHEINNPLAYVLSNVEVARDWLNEALAKARSGPHTAAQMAELVAAVAQVEEPLRDASDGATRVAQLVVDIKSMARPTDELRAPRDLRTIIETAVKLTANAVRHSASVRVSFGETPLVAATEGPLVQVFVNLLMNAAQAIGEGRADHNEICISTWTGADGSACAEVRDTGPGIPADVLPRVFDPFFTTKPIGGGMGLGLSTSHGIVAGLGGRLLAESGAHGGAAFRLVMPPSAGAATATRATVSPPSLSARRGRVLVIDDEPAVALSISRILRDRHDVTMLSDGREAIALLRAGTGYDLIFCDLMMPNMSGIEFYQSLAVISPKAASKVVFMTGGAFTPAARAFLDSVGRTPIAKPFTMEKIRAVAAECVA